MSDRTICSKPEHEIQTSNRYRIPTSSGIMLGATISRPAGNGRFPAIVWYDPYRSGSDGKATPMAEYFARRGYAFCYLNVRGTGNSEGVTTDEYMPEETQDGADAIAWLAGQAWCSGKVGMCGASYSGFNTLQVAALQPPALGAIAPAYFTDQRYTDDCHYKGGCLRGFYDMLAYGLMMVPRNALPPYPETVGEKWSELWQQRLEHNEPYLLEWIEQPIENDYWAVGSIRGAYDKIKAATLLIGGWRDGYPNPPLRTFRALRCPKRLLVGPWSHTLPHVSHCGPRIDYHFELLRWWDRYLKDMDNGVDDEAAVQVYEREYEEAITDRTHIAGRWRMAADLPADEPRTLHLDGETLRNNPPTHAGRRSIRYRPGACTHGGLWDGGTPFNLPGRQNADEAEAINFTTPPLPGDLKIFGNPTFHLFISSDVPVMPVACRLCEVGEDGTSVLITKGLLNATRRDGMNQPRALVPGEIMPVEFHFEATCWRLRKGHRLRLSINGSDFPNIWPTPLAGTLTVHFGPDHPSRITLPVWGGGDEPAFDFAPSPEPARDTGSGKAPWRIVHDVLEDRVRFQLSDQGEHAVSNRDPARAYAKAVKRDEVSWPGCHVRSEASGTLVSDEQAFHLSIALNVYMNDGLYFQRNWTKTVKRALL